MSNEHPNERLVTDAEADEQSRRSLVSRRDLLAGSTMLAGLLAYTADPSESRGGVARAQTGSEPLIQLGDKYELDEDGSNDFIIRHVDNGEVLKYDASADKFSASKAFTSLATDEASVTGETTIEGALNSNKNPSAASWVNIIDTEVADNRSELNASLQIVPDKTGWYFGNATAYFSPGADGDIIDLRLFDVDGSTEIQNNRSIAKGAVKQGILLPILAELTAGTTYEVQYRDFDSSSTLYSDGDRTQLVLQWSPIQP